MQEKLSGASAAITSAAENIFAPSLMAKLALALILSDPHDDA